MAKLTYAGAVYEAAPGETVLETLLRHAVPVANSCRAGACQSCLLRAATGPVPDAARQGLKSTLVEQGYFLSCVCRPEDDLILEPAGGLAVPATIMALQPLSPTVLRVQLQPQESFAYRAGQYLVLCRPDGLARSYSIASLPASGELELHVRFTPGGQMSTWLFEQARPQEAVSIRGPAGDCFYTAGQAAQPLLLAGTGTGLAPLLGILKDALGQGHTGPIHLFHGALRPEGLYLRNELLAIAARHPQVNYTPVVLTGGEAEGLATGALDQVILAQLPRLAGFRAYICGDPNVVQLLRKKVFLAGISSRDIFADAFLQAPPPA